MAIQSGLTLLPLKCLNSTNMTPSVIKAIRLVHLIFAVKHDGRHKSRLVAGGHLTALPEESVYSGVVSL